MSIAAQCSDCCSCPTPTVEWDSRSASGSVSGFAPFDKIPLAPWGANSAADITTLYLRRITFYSQIKTLDATYYSLTPCCALTVETVEGSCAATYETTYPSAPSAVSPTTTITPTGVTGDEQGWETNTVVDTGVDDCDINETISNTYAVGFGNTGYGIYDFQPIDVISPTRRAGTQTYNLGGRQGFSDCTGETVLNFPISNTTTGDATLSLPQTRADLVAAITFSAWDDDWNDTAGSFRNDTAFATSVGELGNVVTFQTAVREARYRLRFKIPQVRTGKLYRATWVERFIPEAGTTVTSVEVYARGVYRPTVTLSAPPSGGTQARAVAVMSTTGTVSAIRILNPGSGYTSAPTVTVQAASGGGTTSTGWTATLTAGQVTAIAGGSAGNYRPALAFSGGGGSGATATATMDEAGGIASVALTAPGSGYTSAPTLSITARNTGATAADLLLHLGTETARCVVWDGITPGGYNPATPSTYPILGDGTYPYFSLPVPATDGITLVANLRAVCDGTACPP
jgi:hypothetical protein